MDLCQIFLICGVRSPSVQTKNHDYFMWSVVQILCGNVPARFCELMSGCAVVVTVRFNPCMDDKYIYCGVDIGTGFILFHGPAKI